MSCLLSQEVPRALGSEITYCQETIGISEEFDRLSSAKSRRTGVTGVDQQTRLDYGQSRPIMGQLVTNCRNTKPTSFITPLGKLTLLPANVVHPLRKSGIHDPYMQVRFNDKQRCSFLRFTHWQIKTREPRAF